MKKFGATTEFEEFIASDPFIGYMIPSVTEVGPWGWRGVECDVGWNNIILDGLRRMALVDPDKTVRIVLIKEKFGTMRFHVEFQTKTPSQKVYDDVHALVLMVEQDSAKVCEKCGTRYGVSLINDCWIKTYCEKCNQACIDECMNP